LACETFIIITEEFLYHSHHYCSSGLPRIARGFIRSNAFLAEIELKMTEVFNEIKSIINIENNDVIESLIDKLNNLLLERNKKCKIFKSQ